MSRSQVLCCAMEMKDTNCGRASVIHEKSNVRAWSARSSRVMRSRPHILRLKNGKHFIFAWSVAFSVRPTLIESRASHFSSILFFFILFILDDHAPVTQGRMRAQYPLPHGGAFYLSPHTTSDP